MEKLVLFTRLDDGVKLYFHSCFPNEIKAEIKQKELLRLGKRLCRLGEKGHNFTWKATATAEWGSFVFKVKGQKAPSLSFEYQMYNTDFKTVSDCENYYDLISSEGLGQFGEELKTLENGKSAVLYKVTSPPETPFAYEYNMKTE